MICDLFSVISEGFPTLIQLSPLTKKQKHAKITLLVRAVEKECSSRFELTRPISWLDKFVS